MHFIIDSDLLKKSKALKYILKKKMSHKTEAVTDNQNKCYM